MATGNLTITAPTGPAVENSAVEFTNVTNFFVDIVNQVIQFVSNGKDFQFDISAIVTFTVDITSGVYTITLADS